MSLKYGEWAYSFVTNVANEKILFDIADKDFETNIRLSPGRDSQNFLRQIRNIFVSFVSLFRK
jgi:hypothetical protein